MAIALALFLPGISIAGDLEPSGAPAPTMKTLDQIPPTWSQKLPAAERFVLVLDGAAVLDKETGLVWEKSPSAVPRSWYDAIKYCYNTSIGGRMGWHLSTVEQLASLVDTSVGGTPKLPAGHPFIGVQSTWYWSATTEFATPHSTYCPEGICAWVVGFQNGQVLDGGGKSGAYYMWCVRGGQSYDTY
jgi:hypothetical protein